MLLIPAQSNEDKGELDIDLSLVYTFSYHPSKQETNDNNKKIKTMIKKWSLSQGLSEIMFFVGVYKNDLLKWIQQEYSNANFKHIH